MLAKDVCDQHVQCSAFQGLRCQHLGVGVFRAGGCFWLCWGVGGSGVLALHSVMEGSWVAAPLTWS